MNLHINNFNFQNIGKKISDIFSGIIDPKDMPISSLEEAYHLSNFLPYQWYDVDSELFISDKHIGFILETSPLVGNSESMQKELSNIFTQILPEESSIQTMIYADKNIGEILDDYIALREHSSGVMQALAVRRAKYLSQLAIQSHLSPYVLRDFKCYMSVCINLYDHVHLSINKATEIKKQIIATLSVVGVANKVMNAEGLIQFLDSIFNADFSNTNASKKKWNRFNQIRDQIIANDTDIVVEDNILKLRQEETELKTFSVSHYPQEWTLSKMSELIGDMFRDTRQFPFPFIMHYGVHIPKQSNDIAKIAMKANMAEKQLYSPIGKYIPNIEREYVESRRVISYPSKADNDDLVKALFEGGVVAGYGCDETGKCLKVQVKNYNIAAGGFGNRVRKTLADITRKAINDEPLDAKEIAFIGKVRLPVYKMVNVLATYKRAEYDLKDFTDIICVDLIHQYITEILDVMLEEVTNLKNAQVSDEEVNKFISQLQIAKSRIDRKRRISYEQVNQMLIMTQTTKTYERKLENTFELLQKNQEERN